MSKHKSFHRKSKQAKHKNNIKKITTTIVVLISLCITVAALAQWRSIRVAKKLSAMPQSGTPDYSANNPATEFVYAGSRLLATNSSGKTAPTDLVVWRPSSGAWWIMAGDNGSQSTQYWGTSGDIPVPGDYDGDGKTDFAIFRPASDDETVCTWYILKSTDSTWYAPTWGFRTDKTTQADFDGDGKTDVAIYRPSNGTWYVLKSSDSNLYSPQLGNSTDTPVPGDYDGDRIADVAVWRSSNSTWYVYQSSTSTTITQVWGDSTDKPVPGDFDGDGKADFATWKTNNTWSVRQSSDSTTYLLNWGYQSSDIAVQGDYDSDGRTDIAVWRPSTGYWYIWKSTTSSMRAEQWGASGDIPVPAPNYKR